MSYLYRLCLLISIKHASHKLLEGRGGSSAITMFIKLGERGIFEENETDTTQIWDSGQLAPSTSSYALLLLITLHPCGCHMLIGSKIKLKFILFIFTAKLDSQDHYIHARMWPLVDSNSSLLTQETVALRGRLQSVRTGNKATPYSNSLS